jgi:DNA replication protein DnaC
MFELCEDDSFTQFGMRFEPTVCDDCHEITKRHYEPVKYGMDREEVDLSCENFNRNCPPMIKDILSGARHFEDDLSSLDTLRQWRPDGVKKSIIIVGKNELMNSIAAWSLYKEIDRQNGNPVWHSSPELFKEFSRKAKDSESNKNIMNAKYLFIHDIGASKITPAALISLYEMILHRSQNYLTTIFTTRYRKDSLKDVLSGKFWVIPNKDGEIKINPQLESNAEDIYSHIKSNAACYDTETGKIYK